jgi:hypothetical protein
MNNDLISRSALKVAIEKELDKANLTEYEACICVTSIYDRVIDNAPTVEEKSYEMGYQDGCEDGLQGIRPQGKWIISYDTYNVCSLCDYKTVMDNYKFCPNCGADLRGKNNG